MWLSITALILLIDRGRRFMRDLPRTGMHGWDIMLRRRDIVRMDQTRQGIVRDIIHLRRRIVLLLEEWERRDLRET